jgi:hypothetical protein
MHAREAEAVFTLFFAMFSMFFEIAPVAQKRAAVA